MSDDSVVITAPSVEEAVILGLTRLTATRDEVDIEVLDEGSKGFLGIGARRAKVRVRRRPPGERRASLTPKPQPSTSTERRAGVSVSEPVSEPAARQQPAAVEEVPAAEEAAAAEETPAAEEVAAPTAEEVVAQEVEEKLEAVEETPAGPSAVAEPKAERREEGVDRERLEEIAYTVAQHLLPNLELDVSIEWIEEERPTMWIALNGRDADTLVGPRARNLHAVQYLFRSLVYHEMDGEYNLVVDADGYRRRRRRSLESLAQEKADRAVELGHTVRLRAMPAHERRIVHVTLRDDDRVATESVGRGRDRAVTIIPKAS